MTKFTIYGLPLVVVGLMLGGCSRSELNLSSDILSLGPNSTNVQDSVAKKIADMTADDVIVSVNGQDLTKSLYEKVVLAKRDAILKEKGINEYVADKKQRDFERQYVKTFVMQRLLADAAFREGVVTTNEVLSHVEKWIVNLSKKRGFSPEVELKGLPHTHLYELAISYIMDKYIHEKIPPKAEVTKEFLDEVRAQVRQINDESKATNGVIRAGLQALKQRIVAEKLDFLKLAVELSDATEENEVRDDGLWGEFEEGDLETAEMKAKVFALPEGGISDVLEDDNGYHLVKVLSIAPEVVAEDGRVTSRERRTLAHIYQDKAPLLIEESDVVLTADLKRQMQMQAVEEAVTALSTNGVNVITYPHGENLF